MSSTSMKEFTNAGFSSKDDDSIPTKYLIIS